MRDPDFVIIGAQKCGTTSLFHSLNAHPDVGMHSYRFPGSSHEVHYFNRVIGQRDLDWYRSGFPTDTKVVGEKSPSYHCDSHAMRRLLDAFPDVKMIFLVRDPVLRFQSQRNMRLSQNPSLDLSLMSILGNHSKYIDYIARGFYAEHLEWIPEHAQKNLFIRAVDVEYGMVKESTADFRRIPGTAGLAAKIDGTDAIYFDVCAFLGIDPVPVKNETSHFVLDTVSSLTEEEATMLSAMYRSANERFYEFIGSDLGWT